MAASATPAAVKLAEAEGIDLEGIEGTGATGKVTIGDVREVIAQRASAPAMEPEQKRNLIRDVRSGIPVVLAADQLDLTTRDVDAAVADDPEFGDELDQAEELARARIKGALYRDGLKDGGASSAAAWLRAEESEAGGLNRDDPWHSGEPGYDFEGYAAGTPT